MITLSQALTALKVALTLNTAVKNWDFEGVSPDSAFPIVGSVWPIGVTPETMGKPPTYEFLCVAALWSNSLPSLLTLISNFNDGLVKNFGDVAPCSPALSQISSNVTLGNITIGAPSFSAASSAGNLRGTWASVEFTLSIRTK